MNETLINAGIVVFIIYAVVNIAGLIEINRSARALRQFIRKTEEEFQPTLSSARGVLGDIEKATHSVVDLSEKIREVTEALTRVEHSIRELYAYYKDGLSEAAQANIAGLKAGVKAGVVTLLKDLNDRKEGSL
jgi:methyl-accepting chemotaxis protein